MPLRRVLIVVVDGDQIRKLALSVQDNATISELAREITKAAGVPGVTLEVGDGFELQMQDGVHLVGEGEIVTARVQRSVGGSRGAGSGPVADPPPYPGPVSGSASVPILNPTNDLHISSTGHYRINFVNAQLARTFAAGNANNLDVPTNGVPAYGGELIDDSTPLSALREEACRVFGWSPADSDEVMVDNFEACAHDKELSCSCAIAGEVDRRGLRSTYHCRLSTNGAPCSQPKCLFSHIKLSSPTLTARTPECVICSEPIASACPKCREAMKKGDLDQKDVNSLCSLTQNAGCGHLHHTHCIGNRDSSLSVGCPSGCRKEEHPREAVSFEHPDPHIVLVYDGDKIVRLSTPDGFTQSSKVRLPDDAVVNIVEKYLISQNLEVGGLSLRIHNRDPQQESTTFTNSTFVSVCPVSNHTNQNYKRFTLFSSKTVEARGSTEDEADFTVDLHTYQAPIIACGCTSLSSLFPLRPPNVGGGSSPLSLIIYAVKRRTKKEDSTDQKSSSSTVATKESTYKATHHWQPMIEQTPRGMSALLSSLYVFAQSISKRGLPAEKRTLATAFAILRFPPAVRALGLLFLNKVLEPCDKVALSESIYWTLRDFMVSGPPAIVGLPGRTLEGSRILLGHIASAAVAASVEVETKPLQEIFLSCSLSKKRLTDPMFTTEGNLVERSTVALFHPATSSTAELPFLLPPGHTVFDAPADDPTTQILHLTPECRHSSIYALQPQRLREPGPPKSVLLDLGMVGRNFNLAVRDANKTDLVARGPLDLKSTDVVPPQIVLDSEGLLAVFTGRGCGAAKDVNFFRPARGGDKEVDVNDVEHALESVSKARMAEGTWEIDSYAGVSAVARPPDEAIVICLDLSESMNKKSGVSHTKSGQRRAGDDNDDDFDIDAECNKAVNEIASKETNEMLIAKAQKYVREQHPACRHAWKLCIDSKTTWTDRRAALSLLPELAKTASRDVLRLSSLIEESSWHTYSRKLPDLACFASVASRNPEALVDFFVSAVNQQQEMIGNGAYETPRSLLDPKTGEMLTTPVKPAGSPANFYVNENSRVFFESKVVWPIGYMHSAVATAPVRIQETVSRWASGVDLIRRPSFFSLRGATNDSVNIKLTHDGRTMNWDLPISTTTRKLYTLVHRGTYAKYSSFTIRLASTKAVINDSNDITIGITDLSGGGNIELSRAMLRNNSLVEFKVDFKGFSGQQSLSVMLPRDAPVMALASYIRAKRTEEHCRFMLWHGLKESGDGVRRGSLLHDEQSLSSVAGLSNVVEIECQPWFWLAQGAIKVRQSSKYLTRLHLMSELFNVFINRASSFDTSVALVLGLVTFSDTAQVGQSLTPVFENFRKSLEEVDANGDTAVYDSLAVAKGILVDYRPDLPNLRKRIIIVSDGDDTCSKSPAYEVCADLQAKKIIVDSVQVGTKHSGMLHAISVATGGYRFFPKTSLGDALSIFDLETMLNSAERQKRSAMPVVWSPMSLRGYDNTYRFPIDIITVDKFPKREEHPRLKESVSPAIKKINLPLSGDERMKRIMREIQGIITDPHPQIDVYVNDADISFFKIIIEAPGDLEACPYRGGSFLLTCDIPTTYPRDPPEFRFVTFILHPNVSKQGKVCVAELGRLWSSDLTLKEALAQIYGLLLEPDLDNPLEIQASLKYYDDDGTYALAAANAVTEHASKTRQEWRKELADD